MRQQMSSENVHENINMGSLLYFLQILENKKMIEVRMSRDIEMMNFLFLNCGVTLRALYEKEALPSSPPSGGQSRHYPFVCGKI
jgi:hypothetical protein